MSVQIWCNRVVRGWPFGLFQFGPGGWPSLARGTTNSENSRRRNFTVKSCNMPKHAESSDCINFGCLPFLAMKNKKELVEKSAADGGGATQWRQQWNLTETGTLLWNLSSITCWLIAYFSYSFFGLWAFYFNYLCRYRRQKLRLELARGLKRYAKTLKRMENGEELSRSSAD